MAMGDAVAHLGLDIVKAAEIATSEKFGDWYRDPWGWPECDPHFASTLSPEDLGVEKDGKRYVFGAVPDFHLFEVPKSFLGIRPAVIQDARTRLAYTAAAMGLAPQLHASLPAWVFGWRVRGGEYSANGSEEWAGYESSQGAIGSSEHAAQTDINSFFASIDTPRLLERIVEETGEGVATEILAKVFEAHERMPGRQGIPQRSAASAMLAQFALRGVDDLIDSRLSDGRIASARRWMDDISFEGPEHELYDLLLKLQWHGRQVGLEMNTAKTILTSGEESADQLRVEAQGLIRLPVTVAVVETDYDEYETTYIDASGLEEAEEQVLRDPKGSPRSKIGMVVKSLLRYEHFDRAEDWKMAATYLPHAADKVGRYLAAANRDRFWGLGLSPWFCTLQDSGWKHLDWVSAQYALAVPSEGIEPAMQLVLEEWLSGSSNLQKVAVAVQRLAVANPARYRVLVADRIGNAHDPLLVRLLALGQLAAGEAQADVRASLRRHRNNALTIKVLDARGWRLPAVAVDFDPVPSNTSDDGDETDF